MDEEEITPSFLLPGYSSEEVHRRVNESWGFIDNMIPWPKFKPSCPHCGSRQVIYSRYSTGNRKSSPNSWRCDVSFKCGKCSHFWTHGIPVEKEIYDNTQDNFDHRTVNYSDLLEYFGLERDESEL